MGLRHQFWVVAKVGGRYRTLAVTHCQNASGTDATRACWRLLTIFSSDANRKLIDHELKYASTKPDDWWKHIKQNHSQLPLEETIPFPFIQTCLVLGTAYDSRLDKPFPFFYPVSAYNKGISPMELTYNNQTGNTIIEITNLNELRYCFMFSPSRDPADAGFDMTYDLLSEDGVDETPRCKPLKPEEYLRYPCVVEDDFDVNLNQWHLITQDTLCKLWPEVPWPDQIEEKLCNQHTLCHQTADIMSSLIDPSFQTVMEKTSDTARMN